MGLSISYQVITERHHGTLRCCLATGQGAEFVIQIPMSQQGRSPVNVLSRFLSRFLSRLRLGITFSTFLRHILRESA